MSWGRALSLLAMLATLLFATSALAVGPRLRTTLSPETIEVGDATMLSLTATPGDKVTQAQLPAMPNGLTLVGQNVSPSYQVTMSGGQFNQVMAAHAQFKIRATRTGTYTLGPPAVLSDGKRYPGDRVTLTVVAKGTLPPRRDPMDPFGMFGPGGPFQMDEPIQPQLMEPDYPIVDRFNLDRARDSGIFLHAVVDKTQAVVGEQVTLSVYVYADVTQQDPELSDPHEVGTSDYLRESLMKPDANIERLGFARAGGRVHAVALLRKYALFPLHAGDLEITPMRVRASRGGDRSSETLTVHVSVPPIDHRPAGYTVGDVGHFTISAEVLPREVERGGAVAVNVELSGWGNLPASLTVPARPNVSWLDPEVKEDLKLVEGDTWGGTRRFSYVVSPKKEGDIDLGEIAVPFYDPRTHSYDVARAVLGVIHVKPGAVAVPDDAKVLSNMPALRTAMSGARADESHLDDSNVFWGLLGLPTLLFGVAVSGRRLSRRIAERALERKTSPAAALKQRLRSLDAASDEGDGRAIDGATIRALETAALAHAGVNVRGVGGEAVSSVLERAGVDVETADELRDLLEACAAARFSPDGVEVADARKRAVRARSVIAKLEDRPKSSER